MKIAVIGGGWAGMAAAVSASQAGHSLTVFEASRSLGGRARAVAVTLPDGSSTLLDNGQHILIGAYTETLLLMRAVGVDLDSALLRLPLALRFPDGAGLQLPLLPKSLPVLPAPLDALVGIVRARGWTWCDKLALLRLAGQWQRSGFCCAASLTVTDLCATLTPRVLGELVEPLCVSALNTPPPQASGQVFLRVLQDALFGVRGGSQLLLPRVDLSELFPAPAARWLSQHGGQVQLGQRVTKLQPANGKQWQVDGETFDAVVLAVSASHANRMLSECAQEAPEPLASQIRSWTNLTQRLRYEAITTVYTWGHHPALAAPLLALRSSPQYPAQFVFDRSQLGGPPGLLAWVVSSSTGEREEIQSQVLAQARAQLGLELHAVQTVVEKRATFACTPGLQRPPQWIAPGLLACGDYIAGPYPATLEGAVRSAVQATRALLDLHSPTALLDDNRV